MSERHHREHAMPAVGKRFTLLYIEHRCFLSKL